MFILNFFFYGNIVLSFLIELLLKKIQILKYPVVIGHDLFKTKFYCNSFQDVPNKTLLRKEKNFRKIENKTFFTNLHAFFLSKSMFSVYPLKI